MLYSDAARIAHKKGDAFIARSLVNEARILIPHTDRNGIHARALLSFASQLALLDSPDEAADLLHSAVVAINSLPKKNAEVSEATKSSTEAAWAEVNDPRSLIDAQELDRAFSSMGAVDLDLTITEARKIEVKSVQLCLFASSAQLGRV